MDNRLREECFMSRLSKDMVTLARQAGGSYKTVADRMKMADRIATQLLKMNIQIRQAKNIKPKHVVMYANHRLAEGIAKRTIQNEVTAIRKILTACGKSIMANSDSISNKTLGISGASRAGTKEAIPDKVLNDAVQYAMSKHQGVAAILQLSRCLGLREEEAVQSVKSLHRWKQEIENNQSRVNVVFGTKGGRPRETTVLNHEKTLHAINFALKVAEENNGKLIDKPNLHQAIGVFRRVAMDGGLTGKHSPHSLRYAYAKDAAKFHEDKFSKKETLAMVSMDLGHGDGRGRYIAQVYYQNTEE